MPGPRAAALGRPRSGSDGDGRRLAGCLSLGPGSRRAAAAFVGLAGRGASPSRGAAGGRAGGPASGREGAAGLSEKRVRVSLVAFPLPPRFLE